MQKLPGKGRYIVNKDGDVIQVPELMLPDGVTHAPDLVSVPPEQIVGPTRVGEWLMVDIRTAKKLERGSRLYEICQELSAKGACGVVESTLIIDFLEAKSDDRRFLLCGENWPR